MLDVRALRLAVALADFRGQYGFWQSLRYWHGKAPEPTDDWLRSLRRLTTPMTITEERQIVELRDCRANLTAPDSTAVHVYGDLSARIAVTGQCEVIVAGDVLPGGSVHGDGIVRVYIGGTLHGEVINKSSSNVWVCGDLLGRIGAGKPSCQIHVLGHCLGAIEPTEDPALLYMEVHGFMPFAAVQRTAAVGYSQFNAVVHRSDCPAGFYPDRVTRQQLADHRSDNRWVVIRDGRP